MNYCTLSNYQCIEVMGEKGAEFLQGQLTNNVMHNSPNLLCNIKGRIIAKIYVEHQSSHLYLLVQKNIWAKAFSILEKPALLSRVNFKELPHEFVYGVIDTNHSFITCDASKIQGLSEISYQEWHHQRLLQQEFELYPETLGLFLPHDLGLENQWIDFKKGCYRGQEIIARMHYLGQSKVHLRLLNQAQYQHLHPGDSILENDVKIGEVVDTNNNLILACVKRNLPFAPIKD